MHVLTQLICIGEQPPAEHDDDADVIHSIHHDDGLTQDEQPPTTAAYNGIVPPPTQAPGMPAGKNVKTFWLLLCPPTRCYTCMVYV